MYPSVPPSSPTSAVHYNLSPGSGRALGCLLKINPVQTMRQPSARCQAASRGVVQHQWEMRASLLAPSTSLTHGDPLATPVSGGGGRQPPQRREPPIFHSLGTELLVCSFPPHPQALGTIFSPSPTQGCTREWTGREAQVVKRLFFP